MTGVLMLISEVLSILTITLCFVLKVPQIIRLIKAGESTGLSLNGLLLELSSYTVTMLYNYTNRHAILSYMEYPIIILQEYIIIALVLHYNKCKPTIFLVILMTFTSISWAFAFKILDRFILTLLLPFTTPVGALSKIMQLVEIIRRKNADSVSILTWFFSVFTNVTRIYTVLMDSADINLLLNFSISSILSGSVMLTALYYQRLYQPKEKKSN